MPRKPSPLPSGPALVTRVAIASAVTFGIGCGSDVIAPQVPPQPYVDAGKDAPAPQPFDAGVADASDASSDAALDALPDQIAPQPPPQPPQPPPQPPQPPQMPPP